MTMPKQIWAALLLVTTAARPYIKIAEPLQDAVVYGEDDGTGQNIRGVRLVLHYYDLPDDGYDRHAAAYDALLERLKELSDAAAKKKDGADAAQPAEAEAPPPAKGAGWGAPGFELQHAMDYAFADVAPDAEAPPPPPATKDVAPPPPPPADVAPPPPPDAA